MLCFFLNLGHFEKVVVTSLKTTPTSVEIMWKTPVDEQGHELGVIVESTFTSGSVKEKFERTFPASCRSFTLWDLSPKSVVTFALRAVDSLGVKGPNYCTAVETNAVKESSATCSQSALTISSEGSHVFSWSMKHDKEEGSAKEEETGKDYQSHSAVIESDQAIETQSEETDCDDGSVSSNQVVASTSELFV